MRRLIKEEIELWIEFRSSTNVRCHIDSILGISNLNFRNGPRSRRPFSERGGLSGFPETIISFQSNAVSVPNPRALEVVEAWVILSRHTA